MTETYFEICNAVEHALSSFTGQEEPDQDTVDLVSQRVSEAVEARLKNQISHYRALLESATTYIQSDLTEDQLDEWVDEIEDKLEEYGVV